MERSDLDLDPVQIVKRVVATNGLRFVSSVGVIKRHGGSHAKENETR